MKQPDEPVIEVEKVKHDYSEEYLYKYQQEVRRNREKHSEIIKELMKPTRQQKILMWLIHKLMGRLLTRHARAIASKYIRSNDADILDLLKGPNDE